MISVNDIVQYTQTNMKYRILWLSQDNTIAYVIRIDGDAFPLKMETNEIQQNLSDKTMVLIQDDPLEYMIFEEDFSEKSYAFRDNIWGKLEGLLTNEPDIYDKATRGKLIHEVLKKIEMSKATLYKHMKRYWQSGKNRNALMFNVTKRGGRRIKKSSKQKLGRPQKYGDSTGKYIDDETEKIFNAVVRKYYHSRTERTFKATYETMVKEYYLSV